MRNKTVVTVLSHIFVPMSVLLSYLVAASSPEPLFVLRDIEGKTEGKLLDNRYILYYISPPDASQRQDRVTDKPGVRTTQKAVRQP